MKKQTKFTSFHGEIKKWNNSAQELETWLHFIGIQGKFYKTAGCILTPYTPY